MVNCLLREKTIAHPKNFNGKKPFKNVTLQILNFILVQYHRQESSKIPMHAGCGKKRGKDYNSRGNPAKFMRDPRNVSRNPPVSANFTREFFMRDAWKYFPRKIDL